jgi:hypothetical protein
VHIDQVGDRAAFDREHSGEDAGQQGPSGQGLAPLPMRFHPRNERTTRSNLEAGAQGPPIRSVFCVGSGRFAPVRRPIEAGEAGITNGISVLCQYAASRPKALHGPWVGGSLRESRFVTGTVGFLWDRSGNGM